MSHKDVQNYEMRIIYWKTKRVCTYVKELSIGFRKISLRFFIQNSSVKNYVGKTISEAAKFTQYRSFNIYHFKPLAFIN